MSNDAQQGRKFLTPFGNWIRSIIDPREYDSYIEYLFMVIFIGFICLMIGMYVYTYLGYIPFIPIGDTEFLTTIVVIWFLIPLTALGIILGVPLFLIFMAIQALIFAIPSELVMLTAGMVWGPILGGIINILGGTTAAIVLFYLARRGGKPFAVKTVGEKTYEVMEDILEKYGIWVVITSRMIPFLPLDTISAVSGVVDIKWRDYLLGTLVGMVLRGFFYSLLGAWIMYTTGVTDSRILLQMLIADPDLFSAQIATMSLPFNILLTAVIVAICIAFVPYFLWIRHRRKNLSVTLNEE